MNKIIKIFEDPTVDLHKINALEATSDPHSKYIIAFTPRSGSSYLCDLLKNVKRFGMPDELLHGEFIPNIMENIPGRTPDEFIRNVLRRQKSKNGVSGLKASWFQFELFAQAMEDPVRLKDKDYRYIYLTRRDAFSQAVSLYRATATSVFHTNVPISPEAIHRLETLEYDFAEISRWYDHIAVQERGWQEYFYENRIFPLCITYEDIEQDALQVLQRIATFVEVAPHGIAMPEQPSVFEKLGDTRNVEWAYRFAMERRMRGLEAAAARVAAGAAKVQEVV